MFDWTQRLSKEALARKTSLEHLEEIPSLNKQSFSNRTGVSLGRGAMGQVCRITWQ
jgi:hypothetical protein